MDLSSSELAVLRDRDFFRLKRSVSDKLDVLFSELQQRYRPVVAAWNLPHPGIDVERGKIFRGENYRGYPYTILDYPKHFSRESVFAIRTMCWWGHEFSIALHLQGRSLIPYQQHLSERLQAFADSDAFFCIHPTPWEYGFEEDNYVPLSALGPEEIESHTSKHGFLKVACRLDLEQWNRMPDFSEGMLERIGRFLGY